MNLSRDAALAAGQLFLGGEDLLRQHGARLQRQPIKVVQKAWGALSLHNGNNVSIDLAPSGYAAVSFAVNGGAAGIHLGVSLESDRGDPFPQIDLGTIPVDTWVKVTVPMNQLNPNGRVFHRVDIQHIGDTGRTYWVDDLELVGR